MMTDRLDLEKLRTEAALDWIYRNPQLFAAMVLAVLCCIVEVDDDR